MMNATRTQTDLEKTYLNFTYYIKQWESGFAAGYQWDSGCGWYDEKGGFETALDAEIYIKAMIAAEYARNKEIYDREIAKIEESLFSEPIDGVKVVSKGVLADGRGWVILDVEDAPGGNMHELWVADELKLAGVTLHSCETWLGVHNPK